MIGISTFAFFCFLVFVLFYLSGLLVKWLVRVNISPKQQIQIIEKKLYSPDEKTNYTVEKIDNLESTVFQGSSYISLKIKGRLMYNNNQPKTPSLWKC